MRLKRNMTIDNNIEKGGDGLWLGLGLGLANNFNYLFLLTDYFAH